MAQNGVKARGSESAVGTSASQDMINDKIRKIKRKHEKAHFHTKEALSYDEQKQPELAIDNYIKGIRYMNAAQDLWNELCQHHPADAEASRMAPKIEKMAVNLPKAKRRVNELLAFVGQGTSAAAVDSPPSYDAAMAQLNRPRLESNGAAGAMTDAMLLFLIEGGVQIYFISNDASVSAPSYPSSLAIYQFVDKDACQSSADSPPAFLQVNDWIYPLVPSLSPVLHADWGAYVFPDVTARNAGCYVGVIIPDTIDANKRQQLEDILKTFTNFREQAPHAETGQATPSSDTAGIISKGIVTASEWISWGVTKGAEKAGQWVKQGSEKLRQHLEPENEASQIDPRVQKGAQYVRVATTGAVKISGFLVDKVGEATSALAKTVAPCVRRTSESILPNSWTRKNPADGRSTIDKISEVATSGLQGFSTVYLGLEQSAKILAKSVTEQTVQTVEYKYGKDAGQLTEDVVYSTTNVVMTASTMSRLGPMAVAKQVAKETGKEAVKVQGERPPNPQQQKNCTTKEQHHGVKNQPRDERTRSESSGNKPTRSDSHEKPHGDKKGRPPT